MLVKTVQILTLLKITTFFNPSIIKDGYFGTINFAHIPLLEIKSFEITIDKFKIQIIKMVFIGLRYISKQK